MPEPLPLPPGLVVLPAGALAVRNFAWLMLLVTGSQTWYLPAFSVTVSRADLPAGSVAVRFGAIVAPMIARACFFVPLFTTTNVTLPASNDVGDTVTFPSRTDTLTVVVPA